MAKRFCEEACGRCLLPDLEDQTRIGDAQSVIEGIFMQEQKVEVQQILNTSSRRIANMLVDIMLVEGIRPFGERDTRLLIGTVDAIANNDCTAST